MSLLPRLYFTAHLRSLSGGVGKSYRPSSPGRSFKMYTKAQSTAQCLQILKSLLPNARHQTESTEVRYTSIQSRAHVSFPFYIYIYLSLQLELVRETIAYITHLENILRPPPAAEEEEATAEDQVRVSPSPLYSQ